MNRFYSGLPRSGKTKGAVIELLRRLRTTRRVIITNMALKLHPWVDGKSVARPGMLRWLQDTYGDTFDAERRIVLLNGDQVRRFYAVRARVPEDSWKPTVVETIPEDAEWKFDANRYAPADYFLDEVHVYWPSNGMPNYKDRPVTGECLGYFSQAGRGGDEVVLISQVVGNVNVKLRTLCQECHWFVNHVHAMMGKFRQRDQITCRVYSSTPPGKNEIWLCKNTLHYDRYGIESCYNTAEGVGVSGNSAADIGQKAKGFPPWGIWVVAAACVAGIMLLFAGIQKGIAVGVHALSPGKKRPLVASADTNHLFTVEQSDAIKRMLLEARLGGYATAMNERPGPGQVPRAAAAAASASAKREVAVGYAGTSNKWVVVLEDGSQVYGRRFVKRDAIIFLDDFEFDFRPGKGTMEQGHPRALSKPL